MSETEHGQEAGREAAREDGRDAGVVLSRGLVLRAAVGGGLMGLANLVPGISGGTMLVAAGVYRAFIDAVSDVSRLRLSRGAIGLLAVVVGAALVSIGGMASVVAWGLAEFRWGMYSLFIGLTLGGAPVLVRLARPMTGAVWGGVVAGAVAMAGVVWLQASGVGSGGNGGGMLALFFGGVAGASAMILPGISGAYLLLLLGQYERIIGAVKDFVSAATALDVQGAAAQLGVLVPVGLGVVVGVALVSNVLKVVLHRYEKATLGVLLGLLLAAPLGLYPFKRGVPPSVGEVFMGEVVTEANVAEFADRSNAKDWSERAFAPSAGHIAGALGLVVVGFAATMGVSRLGRGREEQ